MTVRETCLAAKAAVSAIAYSGEDEKNAMLAVAADALTAHTDEIIGANREDLLSFTRGEQLRDRLTLTAERISLIAEGLRQLVALSCPVGEVLEKTTRADGLQIERVRVPFGVVGIIYEARPNVTADAIGLCIKSGNAVVLRGSADAQRTNRKIVCIMKEAIARVGFNPEFIQLLEDCSREGAREFMRQKGALDVLIPRGSASLIRSTLENATVPVIETGTGNCHIYIETSARVQNVLPVVLNAKTQRPSVCNACESLVFDRAFAKEHLGEVVAALQENGVEVVGDEESCRICATIAPATDEDFYTEFLSLKLSVKIVENCSEAIAFINDHSTGHSEAILTANEEVAARFLREIDSACVYVNASTRFTDGFEFGYGAEMGISTQKLHARGPMGLRELTSYKYYIRGNGQIRK